MNPLAASWGAVGVPMLALLIGCGGGSGVTAGPSGGTIAGSIQGKSWTALQSAYWIGKPSAVISGTKPTMTVVFMFDVPMKCADISLTNWDKVLGDARVLEIDIDDASIARHAIPSRADVAYLFQNYNPSADGGSVTVDTVQQGKSIAGSFDAIFAADSLTGTFDAPFCADGVEP